MNITVVCRELIMVFAVTISVCQCDLFGDINLSDLAKAFSPKCEYKCQNGAKPRPNPLHKPTSNGCGSFGVQVDFGRDLPRWTPCCDQHDLCYDTCNRPREECDDRFIRCLQELCDRRFSAANTRQREACRQAASLIHASTSAMGCTPYLEAQQQACSCDAGGGRDRRKHGDL